MTKLGRIYYKDCNWRGYFEFYHPTNQKLENIDKHQRHCFKEINRKLYASFITNEQGVFILAKEWNKNFIKTKYKKYKKVRKITQLSIFEI